MSEISNLKMILSNFRITNLDLAKATGIDPSLVSRYISGNRKLRSTGRHADAIADYILMQAGTEERIDWLKEQLKGAGLPVKATSVLSVKQNLIAWISTDESGGAAAAEPDTAEEASVAEPIAQPDSGFVSGVKPITERLGKMFSSLPEGEAVDVFMTSDRIRLMVDPAFAEMLHGVMKTAGIRMNIVICVSGATQQLSRVVRQYMGEMVNGCMRFYSFFGTAQNVAEQMYFILKDRAVVMLTETSVGSSEPVGTFIESADFVEDVYRSFNGTYRYSQPMFNIYNDAYTRNMIEVLYGEYCLPGALDVVKDSVNPMYMSYENYCRVLRDCNTDDGEYAWKCNEYRRFKDGFENMLQTGMPCREILSLKRLNAIVSEGRCLMAGLYFLGSGYFELDLRGCRDILSGYIDYLDRFPNFSLLILDDLPELHRSNCWHVKKNLSIAINDWTGDPIMCQSNHAMLVQEFQKEFDSIWERGTGVLKNRAYIASILRGVIREMDEKLNP